MSDAEKEQLSHEQNSQRACGAYLLISYCLISSEELYVSHILRDPGPRPLSVPLHTHTFTSEVI